MSLVADTAKLLGIKEVEVYKRAAIECGHIDFERRAAIWLSMHIQTCAIADELADWCLQKLADPNYAGTH